MIKRLLFILVLLQSLQLVTRLVHADTRETLLSMQQKLEDRLKPVVHAFDPDAYVFVTLSAQTKKKALPMTPFMVKNLSVTDSEGSIRIGKVEIRVLSRKKEFPPSVSKLIGDLAGTLGVQPTIQVEPLPAELIPAPIAAQDEEDDAEDDAPAEPAAAPVLADWLRDPRLIPAALIGFGVLLELSLLVSFLGRRRGAGKLANTLEGGFNRLAGAIESTVQSGALGGGAEAQNVTSSKPAEAASSVQTIPSADTSIAAFSDDAVVALLSDCYWGTNASYDSYASHLWKQIPVRRKQALLSRLPFLADYVQYLGSVAPADLGREQEPYYLAPLAISHLDNAVVAGIVRKQPSLLSRLPQLRTDALPLSARERLELARISQKTSDASLPDFGALSASEPRELARQVSIRIATVEEEREVLAMPDLTPDLRARVLSLGWLTELPASRIEEILRGLSARDLASAWIGPEEVLEKLRAAVPAKKYELIQSYLKQVQPSRDSAAFRKLHQLSLQQPVETQGHEEVPQAA